MIKIFFALIISLPLASCSKPYKYCYKLKPSKNITALQEYKTIYHVDWPLSTSQKAKLEKHKAAEWLHIDMYVAPLFGKQSKVEKWLYTYFPNLRHVKWYDDQYQKAGTIRIVVSDYKSLLPLGPNWYPPQENQPMWNHGRAKAHNLGVMLDDPYELKTTDPLGPVPASTVRDTFQEKIKIDVESS